MKTVRSQNLHYQAVFLGETWEANEQLLTRIRQFVPSIVPSRSIAGAREVLENSGLPQIIFVDCVSFEFPVVGLVATLRMELRYASIFVINSGNSGEDTSEWHRRGVAGVLPKVYSRDSLEGELSSSMEESWGRFTDRQMFGERIWEIARALRIMTNREAIVAWYIYQGNCNKAIAAKLDISVKTVERHRHRLYRKLGVTGTAEVVRTLRSTCLPESREILARFAGLVYNGQSCKDVG